MSIYSEDQIRFLQEQLIPLSRVFDATGMSRLSYKAAMLKFEMIVAVGVSPCKKGGHTLRTPAGLCAQCNTHALAFLIRHYESGEVYVAVSAQSALVKIGTAKNAHARAKTLNSSGYGGATDWKIDYYQFCSKAGRVEHLAQKTLSAERALRTYLKTGCEVDCYELFNCSAADAIAAIREAVAQVF